MKKFILNADDFGMSPASNCAVGEAYSSGILKSASLVANGDAFEEAVKKVIPACKGIGVGIHLNIIEGKALSNDVDKLTDHMGVFNNSYVKLLLKSYLPGKNTFLAQVEKEFRAQIEKIISSGIEYTHIDSHVHTHSIPAIFEIVCRLAKEYGISQVRTQFEKPYLIPDISVYLKKTFFINIIKVLLLNFFTMINKRTIKKYELNTNNFLLGVSYTSMMSALTVAYGIYMFKNKDDITVEALIHPRRYEDGTIDNHFEEFKLTKNKNLKQKIEEFGFKITNYIKK